MCSEVYMPEVTRALALRGAELIFMPAGIDKNRLWSTWRTLIFARAIENLAIVVTTQNFFDHSPSAALPWSLRREEILFESTRRGISLVDVSLDRLRYLRTSRDEVTSSLRCGAKQGVLGPQWQRPELHDVIYPRRLRGSSRVMPPDSRLADAAKVLISVPRRSSAIWPIRSTARPSGAAMPR